MRTLLDKAMVNLFNKLPGHTKTPAGMERKVMRLLPRITFWGSVLVALPAVVVRFLPVSDPVAASRLISTVDILCIAVMVVFWMAIVTVGIGAFVVMVMKGPAYVADPYALSDAEKPSKSMKQMQPGRAVQQPDDHAPPGQGN